jgi:hypothetical protein
VAGEGFAQAPGGMIVGTEAAALRADRNPPMPIAQLQNPGVPPPGFSLSHLAGFRRRPPRYARPRERGELVDRGAASAPVGKLFVVKLRGHVRMPLAGFRPDHRAGVEPAAIDAHRAAEATATMFSRSV